MADTSIISRDSKRKNPPRRSRRGGEIRTVVDLGTTKTTCLMAELIPADGVSENGLKPSAIEILGAAHLRSKGIKAGVVVDLDAAEATLRAVVGQVERMAGIDVTDITLGVSCGRVKSLNFTAGTPIEGKSVTSSDIARLNSAGRSFAERDGQILIHSNRISFRLDDEKGIEDPLGMAGRKISQDLHMVTVDEAPLKHLLLAAERSFLNVEGVVASALASASASVTEEEKKLGVICIDLGGGTTSFSVFAEGHFIHLDSVTLGGSHITFDIARSLSTPLHEAERIKTLYGSVITASSDECELVAFPALNGNGQVPQKISKADLSRVIRPRVEEILSLVSDRLAASQLAGYAGEHVVLTGGASQLRGIAEFAAHYLQRAVRVGSPRVLEHLPESMTGPAFSNPVGQLELAAIGVNGIGTLHYAGSAKRSSGYFSNVGNWLRESF